MKKLLLLLMVLSLTMVFAIPKPTKIEFRATTGDKELDVSLSQFNVEANLNIKSFNKEMTTNYKVTDKKLEMLRIKTKMQPADVYMALEVSKTSGKPMNEVILSYEKNNKRGWGKIAKDLGIKPGSKEFKALKNRVRERKQKKEKIKKMKKLKNKPMDEPKKSKMKSSKSSKGEKGSKGKGKR